MTPRKVYVYEKSYNRSSGKIKGEAILHDFGVSPIGYDSSHQTVGIIEWPNGNLELIDIDQLSFVEPTP